MLTTKTSILPQNYLKYIQLIKKTHTKFRMILKSIKIRYRAIDTGDLHLEVGREFFKNLWARGDSGSASSQGAKIGK